MTRKKISVVIALLLIAIAAGVAGTIAYFSDEETAHNVITSGGVSIELIEKTVDESGAEVNWENTEITDAMPGVPVVKKVSVNNVGASEAWIRIGISLSVTAADGSSLPLTFGQDNAPVLVLGFATESGWSTLQEDGYYYYEQPVTADAATGILLESVTLAPGITNEYQNCTINVVVTAQAVQSKNNGSTWDQATGWPESH